MGADEGILLSDRAFAGSDTWATSYTLAQAIRKIGDYGVILCGKQASDGDTAQVGPGIAAHLNLPQITYVRKVETLEEKRIVAERLLENGYEVIESPLPCVLTVVKEINEPRLPSLKGKMNAKKPRSPYGRRPICKPTRNASGSMGPPPKSYAFSLRPPAREAKS